MLDIPLPGICYPRKTEYAKARCYTLRFQVYSTQGKQNKLKCYDSDQASRYSILSKEIRIKLERDANISPQGVYKIVHFLLLPLTKGLLSFFVAIPKFRGSVVVIKEARDFQNLIFPASIVLHAKHKWNMF